VVIAIAVGIVAVLIAGVTTAAVKGLSSGSKMSPQATHRLGTEICFGFGRAPLSEYHETVATLPAVEAEARTLRSSDAWRAVGDALMDMTTLGPTAAWSPTDRATAQRKLRALHAACDPHLR
jgi:hypothetical protein